MYQMVQFSAMMIENSVEIAAPVERVWELTIDVERLPELTPTMTRVERLDDDPLAVGSRVRIEQPRQRPRVWTVTEVEPKERFAWTTRALGSTMEGRHVMTPTADGTRNTLSLELTGPFAALVGRLLRRPLLAAITTENEGFKAAAES